MLLPTSPLCKLFIVDHQTFEIQIYGQTWRDCVFQVLEPSALGTRSCEAVGAPRCRLCSFATKGQLPSPSGVWLAWLVGLWGPLEFPILQSSQWIVKETGIWNKEPTGSFSNYFTVFGASWESAYVFGKHFKVFSHCTHFLVCASQ